MYQIIFLGKSVDFFSRCKIFFMEKLGFTEETLSCTTITSYADFFDFMTKDPSVSIDAVFFDSALSVSDMKQSMHLFHTYSSHALTILCCPERNCPDLAFELPFSDLLCYRDSSTTLSKHIRYIKKELLTYHTTPKICCRHYSYIRYFLPKHILYIQREKNGYHVVPIKTFRNTSDDAFLKTMLSFEELCSLLIPQHFFVPHRGCLINCIYIKKVKENIIFLEDVKEPFIIARGYHLEL